jgi:hypothetical protein
MPTYKVGRKMDQTIIVKITFIMLGRAFQSDSKHDPEIRREIAVWPDYFIVMMNLFHEGPRIVFEKIHDKLTYRGRHFHKGDLNARYDGDCAN